VGSRWRGITSGLGTSRYRHRTLGVLRPCNRASGTLRILAVPGLVARFLTQPTFIPIRALTRLVTLSATQITNNGLALIPNPAKVGIDGHYPRRGLAERNVHQTRTGVGIMAKVLLLADLTNLAIVLKKTQ